MEITEQVLVCTSFEIKLNIPETEDAYYAERKLQVWMSHINNVVKAEIEAKFGEKVSNIAINWEMDQKKSFELNFEKEVLHTKLMKEGYYDLADLVLTATDACGRPVNHEKYKAAVEEAYNILLRSPHQV